MYNIPYRGQCLGAEIIMDKNKQYMIEAVVGLVVLVTLIFFAVWLLLRKGDDKRAVDEQYVAEQESVQEVINPDTAEAGDVTADTADAGVKAPAPAANKESKGIDLTEENRKKKTPAGELSQTYTAGQPLSWTEDTYQLPELYACWDAYELEAVSDLINLDRVRKITDSLKNSNDFYYYGDTDRDGNPEGKGLAVYANNTYYFGSWKKGLRSGEGMWIRLFPDKNGVVNGIKGVTWHQYSGAWSNDYPNGQGQENIQYDPEVLDADKEDYVIQNAIGGFKNGFYNGEMYIMVNDGDGTTTDWYGTAKEGVFTYIGDKKGYAGKRAIWKAGDGYDTGEEDNCHWILPKENSDYGIAGLKKAK